VYQNFISYLYEAQHASGDTPPIIRSLKLHYQPLVLYTWRVVGRVVWWTLSTDSVQQLHFCILLDFLCAKSSFVGWYW